MKKVGETSMKILRLNIVIALFICLISWVGCGIYRSHNGEVKNFPVVETTIKPKKIDSVKDKKETIHQQPQTSSHIFDKSKVEFRDSIYRLFNKLGLRVDKTDSKLDKILMNQDTDLIRQKIYMDRQDDLISLVVKFHSENTKLKADTIRLSNNAKVSIDEKNDAKMFNTQKDFGGYIIAILLSCILIICLLLAILYKGTHKRLSYAR